MSGLAFAQKCLYLAFLEHYICSPVHCGAGKAKAGFHSAVTEHVASENHSTVSVASAQDAQRLVQPAGEVLDELGDAGNGRAGVDEGEGVVVIAAAVREHGRVVSAAEQTPYGDGLVFVAGASDQLVRLALD